MSRGKNNIINIAAGAITASLYVVLTLLSAAFGLSSGVIQIRFSEMLTVLPVFFPAAVPGLFIGCLVSNIVTGCALWDVVFGSLATLFGALLTYFIGKKHRMLAVLPPVLSNTLIIPFVLRYVYSLEGGLLFFAATVFAGELISCGVLGTFLRKALEKTNIPHINTRR